MRPPRPALLALLLALGAATAALPGCATRPPASDPEALAEFRETNDPIEPWNRGVFAVNQAVDRAVVRPVARAYREVVPRPVRTGVRNVLGNLRSPVILVNDLLQGETGRASVTLRRFLINTTLGVGGIFDAARDQYGLPGHSEDFGQTLAVAGVPEGPYLFLPLLGPSNPRDLLGFGVDIAANPLTWVDFGGAHTLTAINDYGRPAVTALDAREAVLDPVETVERESLDPYATFRSAYRQLRRREIANGRTEGTGGTAPAALGTGVPAATGAPATQRDPAATR